MEQESMKLGAKNIRRAPMLKQLFCDMEPEAADQLAKASGLAVKPVKAVRAGSQITPPTPVVREEGILTITEADLATAMHRLRFAFDPPMSGQSNTICILDTGIRKTHRVFDVVQEFNNPWTGRTGVMPKILRELNYSSSPTVEDVFDHGTAVAFIAAGGECHPEFHTDHGMAPGSFLWNVKVLNDEGEGTSEAVVLAIEEICETRARLKEEGFNNCDPEVPNFINLSLGAPDEGDWFDPVRAACRIAVADLRIGVVAAAGNDGPGERTITAPAVDPYVVAVGSIDLDPFYISEFSGRGPSLEGVIKPDLVFFGSGYVLPSSSGDDAWVEKRGTSFAAPALCGGLAVADEISDRYVGRCIDPLEAADLLVAICVKPGQLEPPQEKDNTYGYGMPEGNLIFEAFFGEPIPEEEAMDVSAVLGMAVPIMMLGMIMPMFKSMR